MALLTQFQTFFVSPFGENTVCDELNRFLASHRILNVEKRLIDGERGTGWLFLVEYGAETKPQNQNSPRVDYREVLNDQEYAANEHLVGMVKNPPKTIKDILTINGVGEARAKQFGEAFLKACLELSPVK